MFRVGRRCLRALHQRVVASAPRFHTATSRSLRTRAAPVLVGAATGLSMLAVYNVQVFAQGEEDEEDEEEELFNFSGTHKGLPGKYYLPPSLKLVAEIVKYHEYTNQPLRVVGSGLSPNGAGFCDDGESMINLALCDRILHIDHNTKQVTVEAGIKVCDLSAELKKHGLQLINYASILDQQVGGLITVGAHGTGAKLPPIDESVVGLTLVTPTYGEVTLTKKQKPLSLYAARVSMGSMGVITKVTLQCVDACKLKEETTVHTITELKTLHPTLLAEYKHLRYMFVPDTDHVVVVKSNETTEPVSQPGSMDTSALQKLALRSMPQDELQGLSAAGLRDRIVDQNPLDQTHIDELHTAELQLWKKNTGSRVDWADRILNFDCGGQQWVNEICMKTSPHDARDIELVENFMAQARQNNVVNHTPIEMRWSSGSRSILSPARGTPEDLFVWIGIIHYLPSQDAAQRQQITSSFEKLNEVFQRVANEKGTVRQHWAKLELPANHRTKHGQPTQALVDFQARLAEQYEFRHVASLRHKYDMNGIMSNDWLDSVMGRVVTESDTLFKRLREMQK